MISHLQEMVRFEYMCPITQSLMDEPVITFDGHSFQRQAILKWFSTGHQTNPLTNLALSSTHLIPNRALKSLISSFKASASGEEGLTSKMFEIFSALNLAISEQFPSFVDSTGLIKLEDVAELFTTIKKVELKCHAYKTEIEEFKNACKEYLPAYFDGYTLKWKELKKLLEQDQAMRKKVVALKKQNIILQQELQSAQKHKETFDNLMILSSNPTAFSEVQIEKIWYDEATKALSEIAMPPTAIFIHITESTDGVRQKYLLAYEARSFFLKQMQEPQQFSCTRSLMKSNYHETQMQIRPQLESSCHLNQIKSFGKALSSQIFNNIQRFTLKVHHDIYDGPEMTPLVESLNSMPYLKQVKVLIDPQYKALHKKYNLLDLVGLKG